MTDKDILYNAIKKAVKNGFEIGFPLTDIEEVLENNKYITPSIYYWIIFNHKFAKAFWKCEHKLKPYKSGTFYDQCEKCGAIRPLGLEFENYHSHLQSMVVAECPLKYLERFV